jgi:hypothetical protein
MEIKIKDEMYITMLWQTASFLSFRQLKGVLLFWKREGG